jgi:hypothetical protein
MAQWFARIAGSIIGPFTSSELIDMAKAGRVGPLDEVSKSREGGWVEAAKIKGLEFKDVILDDDLLSMPDESSASIPAPLPKVDKKRFKGRYECGRLEVVNCLLDMQVHVSGNGDAFVGIFAENDDERQSVSIAMGRTEWRKFLEMVDEAKNIIGHMKELGQIDDLQIFG